MSDRSASPSFFSRQERFARVASTNDVVRDWLAAGASEVCVAVADEQTAGRGRDGRSWVAPPGAALLLSFGFRPAWIPAGQTWRLAALISLAMADAAEAVAGLPDGSIQLKWPNDLVAVDGGSADPRAGTLRKLAGILGETDGLGTADPRVVIGLGLNAGWQRSAFPTELEPRMTSLHELSGGRAIGSALLLETFLARVETKVEELRAGQFDGAGWTARQITTGRDVTIELPGGDRSTVRALGVDIESGGLVVADADLPAGERLVHSGEIRHVRLPDDIAAPTDGRLARVGV